MMQIEAQSIRRAGNPIDLIAQIEVEYARRVRTQAPRPKDSRPKLKDEST